MTKSKDLVLLGIALSMNPDFKRDHTDLLSKFYEHVHKHRFLLRSEDV
jgi:hypothetical protein